MNTTNEVETAQNTGAVIAAELRPIDIVPILKISDNIVHAMGELGDSSLMDGLEVPGHIAATQGALMFSIRVFDAALELIKEKNGTTLTSEEFQVEMMSQFGTVLNAFCIVRGIPSLWATEQGPSDAEVDEDTDVVAVSSFGKRQD